MTRKTGSIYLVSVFHISLHVRQQQVLRREKIQQIPRETDHHLCFAGNTSHKKTGFKIFQHQREKRFRELNFSSDLKSSTSLTLLQYMVPSVSWPIFITSNTIRDNTVVFWDYNNLQNKPFMMSPVLPRYLTTWQSHSVCAVLQLTPRKRNVSRTQRGDNNTTVTMCVQNWYKYFQDT